MQPGLVYSFGPFELDCASRRVVRDGEPVSVSDRQFEVLHRLVAHAGRIVSKQHLIEAAWTDVAVSDNSLEQVISALRRALGDAGRARPYIETMARRGYRFSAPVTCAAGRYSADAIESLLAPHRAFIEGRAALETLHIDAVARARTVFDNLAASTPDDARAHVGLANALAMTFESSRADASPDVAALAGAAQHALEACRLAPSWAEAWATLAQVLHQSREGTRALAAAQRAIALDADSWRNQVRLAYVSWGEERLRAARRAIALLPGLAMAHWLAATVYIARQMFELADRETVCGIASADECLVRAADADDAETPSTNMNHDRFKMAGLHLMRGLIQLATGDYSTAEQEFSLELAAGQVLPIHAREASANAWYAIGALRLRQSNVDAAADAFARADHVVPGHPLALAARAAMAQGAVSRADLHTRVARLRDNGGVVEAALAAAAYESLTGNPGQAAGIVGDAILQAPAGSAGWMLPIDPLLQPTAHPETWKYVLTLLRNRAA